MTLVERIVVWVMTHTAKEGSLTLTLPSGTTTTIGSGDPIADVGVVDSSVLPMILRHGATGFAEAYMEDRLETSDIAALLRWGAANHDGWFTSHLGRFLTPLRKLWLRIRPERRHPRVTSMVDHYNLGNDFYASWLDPTMTYSSARFTNPDQSLEAAQRHKYETIAHHVGLAPGMTVLEIGCGWGGFAEYAAGELGCAVVGLTIAEEQARFARKRIAGRGLTDLVDIRLQDFREVEGTFDAVVSIEMIESIDESQWPELFATISRTPGTGCPGRDAGDHHCRSALGAVPGTARFHPAVHLPGRSASRTEDPQRPCRRCRARSRADRDVRPRLRQNAGPLA